MNLKLFRISSLITYILLSIISIILLYFSITNIETDSIITITSLALMLVISLFLIVVSIKNIKNNECMMFDLAFEKDGSINKVALIIDIILLILSVGILITGFVFLIYFKNLVAGFALIGASIFFLLNTILFIIYIINVNKEKLI